MARNPATSIANKATSTKANRVIILSVGAGVGVILMARISGAPGVAALNGPGSLLKIGVGTGATVIVLMVIAEISPEIAMGLAMTIGIAAVLSYGVPFAQVLMKGTTNPGIPQPKGK